MKRKIISMMTCLALALASCDKDKIAEDLPTPEQNENETKPDPEPETPEKTEENTGTETLEVNLMDFVVEFNESSLSESESVPTGDKDYVENATFDGTISITYNGTSAAIEGDADGVAQTNGADVSINAEKSYKVTLKGNTSNGSLTIESTKAMAIILDGVEMNNPDGAAINVQSKVTTYVVAEDGTTNSLTDGTRTDDDAKAKGAIFSKGKMIFSGKGKLNVSGNYKNGINTKKSLIVRPGTNIRVDLASTIEKGSCLKCESTTAGEGLYVRGGVLNLNNPTVAGKALSADGEMTISGGRVTAICTGNGLWEEDELDVSGSAGIKCDSTFTMQGGALWIKSTGNGGKGINGDYELNFEGGAVYIITTGQTHVYKYNGYSYDTSPKGVKCDGCVNVNGGDIYVRATGTSDGSEGIEAKQKYNQTGGNVNIYAADDALNTGYSSESLREKQQMGIDMTGCVANKGEINMMGGQLMAISTNCDGMDSNGYINISGGTAIAFGAAAPETSFDCDENSRMSVTGGTLFGLAGAAPNTPGAQCTQCFSVSNFSATANTKYTVKASDGTEIISVTVPKAYNNSALAVSSPKMQKGETYTIGNTSFTTSATAWITSTVSGGMGGGMGGRPK